MIKKRKNGRRKPSVSPEEILDNLLKFEIFDGDKLKPRTDNVYVEVCNLLGNRIKRVNLFFIIDKDRHNIAKSYRKTKGLEKYSESEGESKVEDLSFKSDNEELEENPQKNRKKKNEELIFDIEIPSESWSKIVPIKKNFKNNDEKEILQPGWTDVIKDLIWLNKKLSCAFSFKRHSVNDTDIFVRIFRYCTNCYNSVEIICDRAPLEGEPAKFEVSTRDSRGIPHVKKVRLQGEKRKTVKKELKYIKPKEWRRKKATELMQNGDCEPPMLYPLQSLSRAKNDEINDDLNIKSKDSIFTSFDKISQCVEYCKYVRNIGYNQFFLMYWSPEQTSVYNDITQLLKNPLSLDATGSICFRIKRSRGESSDIYLSQIVPHIDKKNINIIKKIKISEKNNIFL